MQQEFIATYEMLKKYKPFYGEEAVYQQKMLELLSTCDDCFLRTCRVGHFTASALLLNKDMTKVCLMHHRKLDKWMQLGGHCDGDPAVLTVAIKEAQEESGIINIKPVKEDIFDLDIHLIPANAKDEVHYHFDIRFLLHAYDNDTLVKNHEAKALKWVAKTTPNLPKSVSRMVEKLKSMDQV